MSEPLPDPALFDHGPFDDARSGDLPPADARSGGLLPADARLVPRRPLDLRRTLAVLGHGPGDPLHRVDADGAIWRVNRTPDGPATLRLTQDRDGTVHAQAWGVGAAWVLAGLPELVGEHHECDLDVGNSRLLRDLSRRFAGVRTPRTRLVLESLVPAVLEQKVTAVSAHRAWRELLRRFGEPPPGPAPAGMRVLPTPEALRRVPSWEWHRAGMDFQRAQTVLAAARVAARLEEAVGMSADAARSRLELVPGIGVWTSAEVAQRALGDCDAVSYGDFHVAAHVGWALVGRPIDDATMAELLSAYAPHRGRVVRWLLLGGPAKPRFGPRVTVPDMRRL